MKGINWKIILLIILLFMIGFAGGLVYWTLIKSNQVAESAINAAKNAQSQTLPIFRTQEE